MNDSIDVRGQLVALANHLARRREAILSAWRLAIDLDPDLSSSAKSTRTQFVDHIPDVLDALESRLRAQNPEEKADARAEQKEWAAEHGTHRWQQGYDLLETMREWGHLHMSLLAEVERYAKQYLEVGSEASAIARRELARLASEGVCASAARYAQLQQSEAASRLYDLEIALGDLRALELERAESWRQAAHDLRGSAHAIASASAVLNREGVTDSKRSEVSAVLSVASTSLSKLLSDLLDQARLEAGHERRNIKSFDVARVIKEYCETARPLAAERSLFLKCEGPPELPVEGDATKVQRILQNLVLNALKVTQSGGICVTWEAGEEADANQWALCVQDTGPGFRSAATPIKKMLQDATEAAHEAEEATDTTELAPLTAEPPPTLTSESSPRARVPRGEGIGLSIVKRLCELLDASIELQSAPGQGTTFRVVFPRSYPETP
ncbi:MAG TPA: sensor histidine kinase [Steroidobacteraceae bacterium]|nr:sensor histidine kinase [Steroidobacteraceae bacterium]